MSSLRQLAREMAEMRRRLRALETQPQLGNSSIEDAALNVYDRDGAPVLAVGKQWDGTFVAAPLGGPTPPAASAPQVTPYLGGLRVRWDGLFDDGALVPMDFSRVEVHVAVGDQSVLRGTIESPRGGDVLVDGPETPHTVWFVVRSQSGKGSPDSDYVTATPLRLNAEDFGGATIFYNHIDSPPVDPKIGDLWLQAPDNIATRWAPTFEWVPVQDQGIVEALQIARDASEAIEQTNIDLLVAQSTADDAQEAADAAALVAARKTTTFRQATQPPTTGRTVGDEWFDTSNGNRLSIWGANNQWNLAPIGAAGIGATARELGGFQIFKQSSAPAASVSRIGDYWQNDGNVWHRYDGANWVPVRDTGIQQALDGVGTATALADGKARVFVQNAPGPTGLGSGDVGDVWVDTTPISRGDGQTRPKNQVYIWSGTAWTPRPIGSESIQPASLVAKDVVATGTVSAALLEAVLVLATTIVAGQLNGVNATLSAQGLAINAALPGEAPRPVIRLGYAEGNDYLSIVDLVSGRTLATIDDTGGISAQRIDTATWPRVGGRSIKDFLDAKPKGVINDAYANPSGLSTIDPETGIIESGVTLEANRHYQITVEFSHSVNIATAETVIRIRDGGANPPTLTSPIVLGAPGGSSMQRGYSGSPAGYSKSESATFEWVGASAGLHRLLVTAEAGGTGTINIQDNPTLRMIVEDKGPALPRNAVVNRASGGASTPAAPPKQVYDQTIGPTWTRTWKGGGNAKRSDTSDLVQGTSPGGGAGNGRQLAAVGFPDLTTLLAGADIELIEFYAYANHWFAASGGTAYVGTHGALDEPASHPGYGNVQTISNWPRSAGRWVNFTSLAAMFKSGAIRGIAIGPPPTDEAAYYGRFNGAVGGAEQPVLHIRYRK